MSLRICETFHFLWENILLECLFVYIFFNLIFLPSVLIPSSVPNSFPCFEKHSVSVILPNLRFRKPFRHRSVPVLRIFNHVRLRSVFRTLFSIFNRTRIFSVPVPLGPKTEKVRIRARRSGYGSEPVNFVFLATSEFGTR